MRNSRLYGDAGLESFGVANHAKDANLSMPGESSSPQGWGFLYRPWHAFVSGWSLERQFSKEKEFDLVQGGLTAEETVE